MLVSHAKGPDVPASQCGYSSFLSRLVLLRLPQHVRVLVQRALDELRLRPQVGCECAVCVGDCNKGSLECVLERLGAAGRGRVGVADSGQLKKTLDSGRCDKASTARRRDELIFHLANARLKRGDSDDLREQ